MDAATATKVLTYLNDCREWMVELLESLALLESPSQVAAAQTPVFDRLAGQFEALDFSVRRWHGQATGGVLLARPRRRTRGQPAQLLLGHCDTVWPVGTLERMPVRREGAVLCGPGVFDMKGGLVLMLAALQALQALQLEPELAPVVLINSDEEIGSPESTRWITHLAQVVERIWVLEPAYGPSGKLKIARKGVMRFDITVHGKSAHAGLAPEEGVSAILELAYVVQKLSELSDPGRGVTVNVGVVSGGTRPNVVAAESRAEVDVRVPTAEDAERVAGSILGLQPALAGARLAIELERSSLPLEPTPRNQRLWQQAQMAGKLLGLELEQVGVGGASDGNTTSQFTATLDGLGVVGDGAHAAHEFVDVDKMPERAALLALLLLAPSTQQTGGGSEK
jgi:glutamate carboxypeptidase